MGQEDREKDRSINEEHTEISSIAPLRALSSHDNKSSHITQENNITTEVNSALEDIEWVVRSNNRVSILYYLWNSPKEISKIRHELSIHRTTLRRTVEELKQKGWVQEQPTRDSVRLTTAGERFVNSFDELVQTTKVINRFGFLLDRFPNTISISELSNQRVTNSVTVDSHAPIIQLFDKIVGATSISLFSPALEQTTLQVLADQVKSCEKVEIIFGNNLEVDRNIEIGELVEEISNCAHSGLYRSGDGPPYGIYRIDSSTMIVTYDQDNRISSTVELIGSSQMENWANDKYKEIKDGSELYMKE